MKLDIRKSFLILGICLFFTPFGPSHAKDKQEEKVEDTNKRIYVSGSFIGLVPTIQAGGSVGYSITKDMLVEAQYHYNDFVLSPTKYTTTMIGVKNYWFRTFYSDLLVGFAQSEYSRREKKKNSGEKTYVSVIGESWLIGVTVGNNWRFNSGFFIGCDWIAYGYPIATKKEWKAKNNSDVDEQEFEDLKNDIKKDGPTGTVRILSPYLGWSF